MKNEKGKMKKEGCRGLGLDNAAGQALILVVVLIGGIFMVVTAVAGLLTFYQLQEAADAGRSTEAVLAADAGLERALRYFHTNSGLSGYNPPRPLPAETSGTLPNGATYASELWIRRDPSNPALTLITLSATGRDRTRRALRTLQTTFIQFLGS